MNKSKLWTKDFIIAFTANFFVALIFYILMTTLTVYAVTRFNAAQSKAGLASSIFILGACFSRLFAGKYIEVIGRKKLLYGSLLLFLIAMLIHFPVNNLNLLLVVRFIHGAAFGVASTAIITSVMDLIPNEQRGEGTSYFSLSSTAAMALGPSIGLFIMQHAEFNMIFMTCTVFSIISLAVSLFFNVPEARITKEQIQAMKRGFKLKDFFEKKAVPISVIMVFMGIAYSGILSFLNSFAIEINLQDAAGFFFTIYAVVLFVSRPFTGRLLDLKGDNIVIYPALVLFSLSLIILSQAHSGLVLLSAGVLAALGFGTVMSCGQAIAVKESPRHRVGLATSTFFICIDGGMGIGPFMAGGIVPFVGFRGMYLILAIVVFLSIILYHFVHGKKATLRKQCMLEEA